MNLSELTVKTTLTLAFGVLTLIALVVSAVSLRAITKEHERFSTYVNKSDARALLASEIRSATGDRAISARNLVLISDPRERESEEAVVKLAHKTVTDQIASLKTRIESDSDVADQERALFARIQNVESRYGPVALNIVRLALENKRDEAIAKINADCRPLLAALIEASNQYTAYAEKQSRDSLVAAESEYATNRSSLVAACVLAVALAVGLAVAIIRRLVRALGAEPAELAAIAHRVATGDLSVVDASQNAPTGSVLASLAIMQRSLSRVVGEVRAASDSIATGSSQIATGNADLSIRTERQASSLQETAGSMEQMNATVRNNADTAKLATNLAAEASSAATKGGEIVGVVVTTMREISESSKRIVDIIAVIDGIAFQTNILALNAAVEAARAGEQGRGFAVVASEVRSLAQRSAGAAKEIKALINSSVERVDTGSRQVTEAGRSMEDIVSHVKRVSGLITEISTATTEQSVGIEQVGLAVQQLDEVTQQNAALVEESAAAAESLRGQAEKLVQAIGIFKFGINERSNTAEFATLFPALARTE